jgi:glycine/D-amino acid oxidase-like deaminating enzyme
MNSNACRAGEVERKVRQDADFSARQLSWNAGSSFSTNRFVTPAKRAKPAAQRRRSQGSATAQRFRRPITSDGLPLIGRVPGVAGAYAATGYSVWGILNAPATGEALAELIVDGSAHTVDLRPFDPGCRTGHSGIGRRDKRRC